MQKTKSKDFFFFTILFNLKTKTKHNKISQKYAKAD